MPRGSVLWQSESQGTPEMGADVAREERTVELRDGRRVLVRPIRADDEAGLHDAFSRMSERSVYFRFFSPLKRLPEALAQRLSQVDYRNRFALVAVTPEGRIVGVARYDRIADHNAAEVAVAVTDDEQRQGLGSALLLLLAEIARNAGIETFTLIVLPENQSMLSLLRHLGWVHRARFSGGVYEITFSTAAQEAGSS
jgi:RimJ/RimL family protein N-acetyltransferase